jgi:tellurite resistance protein
MFSTTNPRRTDGQPPSFTLVERPGPRTLDGLIAAAAGMALADGRVEAAEPHSLLEFLRRNDLLKVLGRRFAVQQFAAEIGRAAACPDPQTALADRLRPLAGMAGARLVATAAAHVAAADGNVHPREIALLQSLRATLGLVPITVAGRS